MFVSIGINLEGIHNVFCHNTWVELSFFDWAVGGSKKKSQLIMGNAVPAIGTLLVLNYNISTSVWWFDRTKVIQHILDEGLEHINKSINLDTATS